MDIDQLIVRVGKACNFRCTFCNVSDNENHVKLKENIQDIVRNFHYKLKYSDISSGKILITLSGGEPSIFKKECIFALKYIKSVLQRQNITPIFDIQTNASDITEDFARQLKENGIYLAMVSFHTHMPEIFDTILGVKNEKYLEKIKDGITLFHKYGIEVETNTIMNKKNWPYFTETISYIHAYFPFIETFNIGFIQPHGEAEKNLDSLIEKFEIVSGEYNRAIEYISSIGKNAVSHFVGLPACYLSDPLYSTECQTNRNFRQEKKIFKSQKFLVNNLNDKYKAQPKDCVACLYNNICSGIWKNYFGIQKVKPIIHRSIHTIESDIGNPFDLIVKNESLDGIDFCLEYKNGKRVVYFVGDFDSEKLFDAIETVNALGFYKILRLYTGEQGLEKNIITTGVGNIQIRLSKIDIIDIQEIISFSQKYTPQFRITLSFYIQDACEFEMRQKIYPFLLSGDIEIFIKKELILHKEDFLSEINADLHHIIHII